MFLELIPIEWKKYKRTVLPWMVAAGGIFASGVSLLFTATGYAEATWEAVTERGFNFMNILALLLGAVFSGFVFSGENCNHIDNMMFTYPLSRFKFLLSKYIVLLFLLAAMYLTFSAFDLVFGLLYFGGLPEGMLVTKLVSCSLLSAAANFSLVPLTATICLAVRGIGTGVFTGMAYFVTYVSFISTKAGAYIPFCIPDKISMEILGTGILKNSEIHAAAIICVALFLSGFWMSALYYLKHDIAC